MLVGATDNSCVTDTHRNGWREYTLNNRKLTEQQLHTRLAQVKAGIEKLEYEASAEHRRRGEDKDRTMSPIRSRLKSAEEELVKLQSAHDDIWDDVRTNLQSTLDALANDIDGRTPRLDDT